MDAIFGVAQTALSTIQTAIINSSNNLANANTPAFKKNQPTFEDLAYQVINQPGSPTTDTTNTPSGIVMGSGVKLADNRKIYSQGPLTNTDNSLDIAIVGDGFLQVQIPNQTELGYTRAGSLQLNEQGQLVMPNGYLINPTITIPPGTTKISISQDGVVSVTNETATEQVGTIELSTFTNPQGLLPVGENLYKATLSSGTLTTGTPTTVGLGKIQQGAIENSNVNVVEEMVNLLELQREFEISSKTITTAAEMYKHLNQ